MTQLLRLRRPRYADVAATLALALSTGGTAYAAVVVTSADIKDGSILSRDVRDESLKGADVLNGSLALADLDDAAEESLRGAQGPAGPEGPIGPRGYTGATGIQGPRGLQGLQGPAGERGERGPRGYPGIYSTAYALVAADGSTVDEVSSQTLNEAAIVREPGGYYCFSGLSGGATGGPASFSHVQLTPAGDSGAFSAGVRTVGTPCDDGGTRNFAWVKLEQPAPFHVILH